MYDRYEGIRGAEDRLAVAEGFARLVGELNEASGVTETAEAAVGHAVTAIAATRAALVLNRAGRPVPVVVSHADVQELYERQCAANDGPVFQALTGHATVWIRDSATEARWPMWRTLATRLGVRTVLDVPLQTSDAAVGVLSLCHAKPDAFSDDDVAVADLIARHTAIALATARTEASLVEAVDARRLVGQAMGILMERHRLDDEQAFAVLKRYSQSTNTRLRDVAITLIQTRQLPETQR